MKDFKSYKANAAPSEGENAAKREKTEKENKKTVEAQFTQEEANEAADLAREVLAGYNGKSDTAMLNEILRRAEADKRAGKLTNGQIDAFYAQFSPMLTPAQRKKLLSVAERLKKL